MHAPEASMEYHILETGDYIGTESYVDLRTDFDDLFLDGGGGERQDRRRRVRREKEEKEYPPPMPSLARAELSVLRRYYTNDGRLVIKEEKAMNRKFLRSVTADGRLRFQRFPFHEDLVDSREIADVSEDKDETPIGENVDPQSDKDDDDDRRGGGEVRDTGSDITPTAATGGGTGGGGRRMCYKYNSYKYNSLESSASCMFAMPLPAIRPVQI